MDKIIAYVIFDFQCAIMFISFVFSIKVTKRHNVPSYMQYFFWYPTVGFILVVTTFLQEHFGYYVFAHGLINISLLFHFSFLGRFILKLIPKENSYLVLKILFWFFLLLLLYSILICDINKQINMAFFISIFWI